MNEQLYLERPMLDLFAAALRASRLHHAYLLVGPHEGRLHGEADALAASLVCSGRGSAVDACGACSGCRKLAAKSHPDVLHVLAPPDKEIVPVDTVREMTARLGLRATEAATKVVIIQRAERMNPQAQNALLKTLEEPAGATCFLLTTTRPKLLLPTIRSRCQRVRVGAPPRDEAHAALVATGIPEGLAPCLAALVGADIERARALVDEGAEEVLEQLRRALAARGVVEIIRAAAELGADKSKADLALALLEVLMRDALAHAHGALSSPAVVVLAAPPARLASAAARLVDLRRLAALHLNRTMALEGVLFELLGVEDPPTAPTEARA